MNKQKKFWNCVIFCAENPETREIKKQPCPAEGTHDTPGLAATVCTKLTLHECTVCADWDQTANGNRGAFGETKTDPTTDACEECVELRQMARGAMKGSCIHCPIYECYDHCREAYKKNRKSINEHRYGGIFDD